MEFRYYTHHPMVDYANAMDPELYGHDIKERPSTSVRDIGMSVPMGISAQNVAGIYSKIRMGAGSIEIQFPQAGRGQRQAMTPGMFGEDQRQAMRELANINEVKLTTHAAFTMGMMGHDPRDNFSVTNAREGLHEIQRAIDFAADTAASGSVVVHTGEWDRALTDMYLDDPTGDKINLSYDQNDRLLFKRRQQEPHDAQFVLLDDRTSQKMETVQKDRLVSVPKWLRADHDYEGKYQDNIHPTQENQKWMLKYRGKPAKIKKGDYIDYEGNKIIDPYNAKFGRVPTFNPETRSFEVDYKHFNDFKKEAQEQTEFHKKHWKEMKGKEWYEDDMWYYDGVRHADEAFLHATLETNEGHSRGWAVEFAVESKKHLELLKKLQKAKEFYQKLDKSVPEDEKWKLMKQDTDLMRYVGDLIPPDTKHPLQMIEERMDDIRARIEYARQSSASQLQQAEDTALTKRHIINPTKRFKLHAARMYAEAGIRAMQRTKDPNNPIFLAIENIYPERFGGHPEELKYVIDETRKWFVDFLTEKEIWFGIQERAKDTYEGTLRGKSQFYQPGMSKEEAQKLAETYIKATFDTGHANMWRKYWQVKHGQTIEEADKEFKQWYVKEFEKLAKEGYIGNVHLTDNFGFQDDHVAPGQGNAPIKEVMDILKKYGYDKAITVEPGADASTDLSDFHGLMKTWRYLGSPIYGIGMGPPQIPQTWSNVQYSYFGQNRPPYFVFGAYAPSNDWTLWSQVPME